jgi:hypothetical protein
MAAPRPPERVRVGSNSHFDDSWRLRRRMCECQGCQQVLPGGKNEEDDDRSQPFEEAGAGSCLVDGFQPKVVGEFGNGVEGEGQQVEGSEDGGQVLFSVAEIVFKIIALGFQGVEVERVFDAFYTTKSSGVGWGCRFAAPSSMPLGAACGQLRTNLAALYFSSPCPAHKRHS